MRMIPLAEMPGLVGQELGLSDWFLVDQESINRFADTTRDDEWIHVDVDRAEREYGGTIAHGYFTQLTRSRPLPPRCWSCGA